MAAFFAFPPFQEQARNLFAPDRSASLPIEKIPRFEVKDIRLTR
jgi:hypothetical protein